MRRKIETAVRVLRVEGLEHAVGQLGQKVHLAGHHPQQDFGPRDGTPGRYTLQHEVEHALDAGHRVADLVRRDLHEASPYLLPLGHCQALLAAHLLLAHGRDVPRDLGKAARFAPPPADCRKHLACDEA